MKKIKMLLPITMLTIAPSFGAQFIACGPSKTKAPMSKQDIYVGASNIEEVAVESKTEYFDPADPKIVIDVAEPYNANYEVGGVDAIWCGPTKLAQYDENRDYEITRPDVDSTSMVITFLHPEQITKALYIKPTVRYLAEHTISLDYDPLFEGTWTIEGDKAKTGRSFKSEIKLSDIDYPQYTTIIITSITVTGSDGSSRKLIRGVDYTITTDSTEDYAVATVDFKQNVIDGDVSISCTYSTQGIASLSIYICNKLVRSEPYCISEGATSIDIDNPLFLIGCDTYENQTHRISVKAYKNDTELTDVEYNPDNTEDILVRFSPCQQNDNIRIDVTPACKSSLTAKYCFEQDEWSKVLAMISWAEEDKNTFCHFYDTPTKDAKMEDFLGATKQLTWDGQEYDVMVVATNYYHLPLHDDSEHVREDSCSSKTTLFTFKFVQALTINSTQQHFKIHYKTSTSIESDNNYNNWYFVHKSAFLDPIEYGCCIPREILNDSRDIISKKKFTDCFSDRQFVKAIKHVANYTRISNCKQGNHFDAHASSYIRDLFFLPTAVQLGMNYIDEASGRQVPYPEDELKKPVFDYYKNQRWDHDDKTSPKSQLAVKDLLGDNVGYFVATAHSNDKDSGTESISVIETPKDNYGWRMGYHDIDGKNHTLVPCFCL